MKENVMKERKEKIKNIAIIFLIIMLLLTFFSNTIMNYSLVEVSTQMVSSGKVTSKVRGSGTGKRFLHGYFKRVPQNRYRRSQNRRHGGNW
jgi:hypothetical protein